MYDNSGSNAGALLGGALLIYFLILLAIAVFFVIVYWKIFSKAGYSGALGLLMFVPIANLVVICILAFSEWPIYRELRALREQVSRSQAYPQAPSYPQNPQYPQNPAYPQNPQYPRS